MSVFREIKYRKKISNVLAPLWSEVPPDWSRNERKFGLSLSKRQIEINSWHRRTSLPLKYLDMDSENKEGTFFKKKLQPLRGPLKLIFRYLSFWFELPSLKWVMSVMILRMILKKTKQTWNVWIPRSKRSYDCTTIRTFEMPEVCTFVQQ